MRAQWVARMRAQAVDNGIRAALAKGPAGLEVILEQLPGASRRTVQRRLFRLVADGQLQAEGKGRARRYALIAPAEPGVELSTEGRLIQASLRQPLAARAPAAYTPDFLGTYTPNVSAYLSRATRDHLYAIGRSPGEARPAGTYARDLFDRLLIDLSWASSRLEGNTYSLLDTQNLIELGQAADGKDATEAQMILNHKAAIELLIDNAETIGFNRHTLFSLHGLLADELLADPNEAGRLRRRGVQITGSVFQPLGFPQQIDEQFSALLEKAEAIADPFEQAFFVMVQLPYLQPFIDVNKRVSRLAANIPFIRKNLCPLSFVDVPEGLYVEGTLAVYEQRKTTLLAEVFTWAYERSAARYVAIQQVVAQPDPFRQRHRQALFEGVAELVRQRAAPTRENIARVVERLVAPADQARLVEVILADLERLHEGNFARYHLRFSEFQAWREAHPVTGQR
ncbi:MAG: Fic family protein [Deltaproteobacteria bacterium]|nr:Fic family protein [Deltaproteobacteria bacterium]